MIGVEFGIQFMVMSLTCQQYNYTCFEYFFDKSNNINNGKIIAVYWISFPHWTEVN